MPEGINTIEGDPYDATGKSTHFNAGTIKIDRSGPDLRLSDDLATLDLDDSGRDLFNLHIEATDGTPGGSSAERRSGVGSVSVFLDGTEEERFEPEDCGQDSCPLITDYLLDTDVFADEGSHTIGVVATDRAGNRSPLRNWTIRVPRENYYADQVAAWKADVERRVDDALPVVPLSGPIPALPDRWRDEATCEASADAMRACYEAGMQWGRDVRLWLDANLTTGTGAASQLPDLPTFEYAVALGGTQLDLTRRLRDAFTLAKRLISSPQDPIEVGIGFHEPVDAGTLAATLPILGLQADIGLTGIFDPGGADISGATTSSLLASPGRAIEDFYREQVAIANEEITELEQEPREDPEDTADYDVALAELRAFRTHLELNRPFVKGMTLRLASRDVVDLLDQATGRQIKEMAILPTGAPAGAVLDSFATNSGAVAAAAASRDDAGDSPPPETSSATTTSSTARFPTCAQAKQAREPITGRARRTIDPNPLYFAPSRFKYDTVLGQQDGNTHRKLHRLRLRWQNGNGLAWLCGDRMGDRGVEMEAAVFPRPESEENQEERWSDNWEDKDVEDTVTQHNLPERIYQDDLATGKPPTFTDKARFPDFAIITDHARAFRYRKLYRVNFVTNDGPTDVGGHLQLSGHGPGKDLRSATVRAARLRLISVRRNHGLLRPRANRGGSGPDQGELGGVLWRRVATKQAREALPRLLRGTWQRGSHSIV